MKRASIYVDSQARLIPYGSFEDDVISVKYYLGELCKRIIVRYWKNLAYCISYTANGFWSNIVRWRRDDIHKKSYALSYTWRKNEGEKTRHYGIFMFYKIKSPSCTRVCANFVYNFRASGARKVKNIHRVLRI